MNKFNIQNFVFLTLYFNFDALKNDLKLHENYLNIILGTYSSIWFFSKVELTKFSPENPCLS